MFTLQDASIAAKVLNVTFDKFTLEEFLDGMNIELEHGIISPKTNVTNDKVMVTAKIALAHLNEYPNYYHPVYGLRAFEKFLDSKLKENKS